MSRILDAETGKYDPQVPAMPETVEVDPSELPQIKPDVYAEVDHRDFSNAGSLSRVQQLTMASLAQARGDTDVAMRWKQQAHQRVLDEERAVEAQRMHEMMTPQAPVHHTGPLTERHDDSPWENDAAYLELARERADLGNQLDSMPDLDDDFLTLSGKAAVLDDKMADRKAELVEAGRAAGTWTEADERARDARQSLGGKATEIAGMFPATTAGTDRGTG